MNDNRNLETSTYESILKQATKKRGLIFRFSKTYPAYITLAVFLVLSFLVWNLFEERAKTEKKVAFDKATFSVMSRLERQYQTNYQVLMSMRGLYDNLVQVVRDYFQLYGTMPTRTYQSIISLMYIQRVDNPGLGEYIHYVRSQGHYDYEIHPAGVRDEYLPVEFIVPEENNRHMIGLDFATIPLVKKAIYTARDKDITTSTPVFSVRGSDTLGSFLMTPVYKKDKPHSTLEERRQNFDGVVIVEINSPVFFDKALGNSVASDSTIVFECVDTDESNNEKMIFKSRNHDLLKSGYTPLLKDEQLLKIADRDVKIKFFSAPHFGGKFQSALPLVAFGISLTLSFAFFGFVLSVTTSRMRAVDLADRMTASQRRILVSSKDIIAVLDLQGVWKSMNPASMNIFGYEPESLISKKIDLLFAEPSEMKRFYSIADNSADDTTERMDIQMTAVSGEVKWISWSFNISRTDGLIYAIGRDVTLEKIAEEQARLRSKQIQLAEQFTREASEFKTYFITKLSHQLRNSLTSIIGYLQLLSGKVYESEEEHDTYIGMAVESSEELFNFVSDIIDVALKSSEETYKRLATINFEKAIKETAIQLQNVLPPNKRIDISIMEESKSSTLVADMNLLVFALLEVCTSLSEGMDHVELQISAQENSYEGATEIHVMTPPNPLVSRMIDIFKGNMNNLIEALKYDKNDVILHFAIAASCFRMMNGIMSVDTFGSDEGNLIQIYMPLNKVQS